MSNTIELTSANWSETGITPTFDSGNGNVTTVPDNNTYVGTPNLAHLENSSPVSLSGAFCVYTKVDISPLQGSFAQVFFQLLVGSDNNTRRTCGLRDSTAGGFNRNHMISFTGAEQDDSFYIDYDSQVQGSSLSELDPTTYEFVICRTAGNVLFCLGKTTGNPAYNLLLVDYDNTSVFTNIRLIHTKLQSGGTNYDTRVVTWKKLEYSTTGFTTDTFSNTLFQAKIIDNNFSSFLKLGADIDGEDAWDESGFSVSLSDDGTIVAIGAKYNDGVGGADSGHVRVYEYNGGAWGQLGADIDGEAVGDESGYSISLSSDGTIVAIGAIYNNANGTNSGHVRVYEYNGGAWGQLGADIDGEAVNDYSGYSVSLSSNGTIVAIGAKYNDGIGDNSGHVRVYEYNGTAWGKLGADIDGEAENDYSGYSVSLSSNGTIVAIGARLNDANGSNSGHVRVYEYNGTAWGQLGADIDGEAANDRSGHSVSLSSDGTIVAIGAKFNDANGLLNSGHVRVYKYNGTAWGKLGADIDGYASNDYSGHSVSLSSDGTIVAIGAPGHEGSGLDSGHVRLYKYNGGAWEQLGADIDGEVEYDESGRSVSLSSDGTIVAIGSVSNDANGINSGHVRVYEKKIIDTTPPTITLPGTLPTEINQNATYILSDEAANDDIDGNVTASLVFAALDTSALGNVNINYTATDKMGNTGSATRQILVVAVGGAAADPFIQPIFGKLYEIPNTINHYRMVEGDDLIVNASYRYFTPKEKTAIRNYYYRVTGDMIGINSLVVDGGVAQNKAFIQCEGITLTYDYDTKHVCASQNVEYSIEDRVDGKGVVFTFPHSKYGKISVDCRHYINPQAYSGMFVTIRRKAKECIGLLVRNYNSIPFIVNSETDTTSKKSIAKSAEHYEAPKSLLKNVIRL